MYHEVDLLLGCLETTMTKLRRRVHKLELDLLLVLSGHVGDQTLQKVQNLHDKNEVCHYKRMFANVYTICTALHNMCTWKQN